MQPHCLICAVTPAPLPLTPPHPTVPLTQALTMRYGVQVASIEYTGFRLPTSGAPCEIDVVDVDQITARDLWRDYVSQRKPVSVGATCSHPAAK
eukprot:18233-Chlamydomonas_euryale.AAC.1